MISNHPDEKGCIEVPQALLDAVHSSGFRIDMAETILLTWWLVDGWNLRHAKPGRPTIWKRIRDTYFQPITKDDESRANARRWLVDEGFLEIRQVVCADGVKRNRRIKKKESQSYRTKRRKNYVDYRLCNKNLVDCLPSYTAEDAESQATRKNLGLLERKSGENGQIKEKNREKQRNRDQQSLLTLMHNKGVVKRGQKVNRLFSPWTGLRKELRSLFVLEGQEIAAFDLQAAQPTLMASMAEDEKMLAHCQSDKFYEDLAEELGVVSRDKGKKCFYPYVYGPIRKEGTSKPQALEIQNWMAATYPTAAKFVDSQKQKDYRLFSRQMQNREAKIFVDSIFRELTAKGIVSLTIHDSIFFGINHQEQVKAITEKHLSKHIKKGLYKIN